VSWAECPHCGERNFSVTGWVDLDRCGSCGRALGAEAQVTADARVREALGTQRGHRRRFRPRRAVR
jgi:hypothetical protein